MLVFLKKQKKPTNYGGVPATKAPKKKPKRQDYDGMPDERVAMGKKNYDGMPTPAELESPSKGSLALTNTEWWKISFQELEIKKKIGSGGFGRGGRIEFERTYASKKKRGCLQRKMERPACCY